ncbi:TetR/AcrR family transcriptional regulator [Bacillus massiliigorillae]|uniref:TetR/AcrR family transcriptional regulator n=1 Tax=Bacillus massiliigorillae TaxID=1243664 RepID=UPI0003A410A8|nr:TetR/AcrR family transcriptional regulator [Bacillus massiliigorillae]
MTSIRETGTKTKIKHAFLELLIEKGIDSLTISDIARKANINRGTFYLHYLDKYDLLDQLEIDFLQNIQITFEKYRDDNINDSVELIPYEAILEVLKYALVNMKMLSVLMSVGRNNKLIDNFKEIIKDTIIKKVNLSENLSLQMEGLPHDYAEEMLLSSIISIIQLWIKKGALETPEEIASMIIKAKKISPFDLLL